MPVSFPLRVGFSHEVWSKCVEDVAEEDDLLQAIMCGFDEKRGLEEAVFRQTGIKDLNETCKTWN